MAEFSEGRSWVMQHKLCGYIDSTGNEITPIKYERASDFSAGLAKVMLGGAIFYVDYYGNEYPSREAYMLNISFTSYAERFIRTHIDEWQIKGEYEKTYDYNQRVNDSTRNALIARLMPEAEAAFIAEQSEVLGLNLTLHSYDADNETYMISDVYFGDMIVSVPIAEAPAFRQNWKHISVEPEYVICNDRIAISAMKFISPDNNIYIYSSKTPCNDSHFFEMISCCKRLG